MDSGSSIISSFNFVSYKIDRVALEMYPSLDLLSANKFSEQWSFGISIRTPEFHKSVKQYLCGVSIALGQSAKLENGETVDSIKLEASIVGLFGVDDKFESKEKEQQIIFHQMPTILLPYLRGAITSLLANAGYGSVILPLINMNEAAKKALENSQLKIMD